MYTPGVTTEAVPFFFGFPDGVFHYVCAECDALCCRGQGFGGNVNREMGFLLQEHPALSMIALDRERDLVDLSTPTGQCFFLRQDNLCQIEVDHGHSKKPGVCLIFPFNRFWRIGDTVVVTPHILCPLRVQVPARPGEVTGTHSMIEETIRESQFFDAKYVSWYLGQSKLPPKQTPAATLDELKKLRTICEAAIGNGRFIEVLTAHGADSKELSEFVERTAHLMAWPQLPARNKRDTIDDILIALALPLLFDRTIFPKQRAIRKLALIERLVRSLFSMQAAAPKPQAVYGMVDQVAAVLSLLAYGDENVRVPANKEKPNFGHPELALATVIAQREVSSRGVFRALEKAFAHIPAATDRTALTHYLGDAIRGPVPSRP